MFEMWPARVVSESSVLSFLRAVPDKKISILLEKSFFFLLKFYRLTLIESECTCCTTQTILINQCLRRSTLKLQSRCSVENDSNWNHSNDSNDSQASDTLEKTAITALSADWFGCFSTMLSRLELFELCEDLFKTVQTMKIYPKLFKLNKFLSLKLLKTVKISSKLFQTVEILSLPISSAKNFTN